MELWSPGGAGAERRLAYSLLRREVNAMDKKKLMQIVLKVLIYLAVFAYFWFNVPTAC